MTTTDPLTPATHDLPLDVTVHRGDYIESRHQVHGVIADRSGTIISWGDAERLTMPRSAIKSTQVLPLLTTGAADAFDVSDDELALASSSHSGEPDHVTRVEAWLTRLGLSVDDLECGAANPINSAAANEVRRSGHEPTRLHNCCSGKHSGFLTIARHLGIDHRDYLDPAHPVQQHVTAAIESMTRYSVASDQPVIDGCGIPVWRIPLHALAGAMARLVDPVDLADDLRVATARVTSALPSRAWLVSGTGRAEAVLEAIATEPVILKGGAEGVFMAALPQRGLGIALKAEDGNGRAVDHAISTVLHSLGVVPEAIQVGGPLRNHGETIIGSLRLSLPA